MPRIVFQNMQRSDIACAIVKERIEQASRKFPELARSQITVTLTVHNSRTQPGPDLASVKLLCRGGRYDGLLLRKDSFHLYVALAHLVDDLVERLGRHKERERARLRPRPSRGRRASPASA